MLQHLHLFVALGVRRVCRRSLLWIPQHSYEKILEGPTVTGHRCKDGPWLQIQPPPVMILQALLLALLSTFSRNSAVALMDLLKVFMALLCLRHLVL